jgi:hypothetical protein
MRSRSLRCIAMAAGLASAVPAGLAQPQFRSNEPVFQSGNWFVVRSSKPGSDQAACTGFYKSKTSVQLGPDSLLFQVPGQIESIALQYGKAVLPARAPRTIEKEVGAVVVSGAEFELARRSKVLDLKVATSTGNPWWSISLKGMSEAVDNIKAGCPAVSRGPCSALVLERMKEAQLTSAQIDGVCR